MISRDLNWQCYYYHYYCLKEFCFLFLNDSQTQVVHLCSLLYIFLAIINCPRPECANSDMSVRPYTSLLVPRMIARTEPAKKQLCELRYIKQCQIRLQFMIYIHEIFNYYCLIFIIHSSTLKMSKPGFRLIKSLIFISLCIFITFSLFQKLIKQLKQRKILYLHIQCTYIMPIQVLPLSYLSSSYVFTIL
jgi:hypothetical protein